MTKAKDLSGHVIGRWTVLKRVDNASDGSAKWLCRCACGTVRAVRGKRLLHGASISCGCYRVDLNSATRTADLVGQVFGSWTVLHLDRSKHGRAFWLCRCACGTERSVNGTNLRRGLTRSCGKCPA